MSRANDLHRLICNAGKLPTFKITKTVCARMSQRVFQLVLHHEIADFEARGWVVIN